MKRSDLHKIIQEEVQDYLIEEGIVNWMLDKAERFVKSHFNHVADYQYARIINTPEFRSLSKNFNMNEKDFMKKATDLIKRDPKKFQDILAYDAHNSKYKQYFK